MGLYCRVDGFIIMCTRCRRSWRGYVIPYRGCLLHCGKLLTFSSNDNTRIYDFSGEKRQLEHHHVVGRCVWPHRIAHQTRSACIRRHAHSLISNENVPCNLTIAYIYLRCTGVIAYLYLVQYTLILFLPHKIRRF